jgi:catechol 2,3-dioxygenase-like lactoylglutathione lyase family enzyme/nitrite reductase/ring-hydroxylating ferredoxin subunit
MPVGHFHHIVFDVSDLDRSKHFYEEVIGLDPVPETQFPLEPGAPSAAFRTAADQYVVLVQSETVQPDGPAGHTNFMLDPNDYPAVFERLKREECLVHDHLADQGRRSVGVLSTYFDDPDGRRLQITAYTDEAFQLPAAEKGKIVVGRVEDFPVGSVTHNKEGKFFLVRLEGGVVALNQVCTHQQCPITYQPEHYRFWCTCHNRKFTRLGEQIAVHRDVPPLHRYDLEIVDGQIVVDTDRTIPRGLDEVDHLVPINGVDL